MGQTYATINLGTQTGAQVFGHLADRTDTIRSCFSGDNAPSSPVEGQLWWESDRNVLQVFDGTGWVEVGTFLNANVDYQLNQLLNARMQNSGSNPTPAAGNVAYIILHTGAAKLKVVVTSTRLETILSVSNLDLQSVPITNLRAGTGAPALTTFGTTPVCEGWLLDNATKRLRGSARLPAGYSADADVKLRVHCLLASAETAADTIDAVCDWKKQVEGSTDSATGTSSQDTVSVSVGANAGQYTYHEFDIPLAFNDADNPLVAGVLIHFEFGLSAITSVTGIIVQDVEFVAPCGIKITE
jgi:hypothetical protein